MATDPTPSSTSSSPSPPTNHRPVPERLGMPFDTRLLLAQSSSFLCGFILGASHSGHQASLRFRAENAHRLPISQPGWYLYHKSKNYVKARTGIVQGLRRGTHLALWTSLYFLVEESIDVFRGTWRAGRTLADMEGVDELDMRDMRVRVGESRDWISSAVAGVVTAGVWSAWNAFPLVMAARTIRVGAVVGVGFGVAQDGLRWVREREGVGEESGSGRWDWIFRGAKNKVKEGEDGAGVKD